MAYAWTVRDSKGELLTDFVCSSRLEVGRKVAPSHFDPFRLQVSSSYREVFDRVVTQALQRQGWRFVRTRVQADTTQRKTTLSR